MLFNRNDNKTNERILYKTKPNMLFGCKKAIYGAVLLIIVLFTSPMIIKAIGKMQVYLISQIKLPLTRYAAIGVFVIILIIILYIIWQLINWYSLEYTLTDSRIIVKSGILSTKKTYMPYSTIQDVNTSQNIFARLFNIGSVSVFSAYDNNLMELKNISNPSEAEEIIFSNMIGHRNFQQPSMQINQRANYIDDGDYLGRNEFYDEFEPITPITHESNNYRRDYEYYPEDLSRDNSYQQRPKYDYEPYEEYGRANDFESINHFSDDGYYDRVRGEYSYSEDNYYSNNNSQFDYNGGGSQIANNDSRDIEESSENVIKRHFDKFKK